MPRQQFRKQLLAARQALSTAEREAAAQQVSQRLLALPELQQSTTVGSYYSVRAELPTHALNQQLQLQHRLALPVLHPISLQHLLFLKVHPQTRWQANTYNIPEPQLRCPDIVPLSALRVLLVPLVGFDAQGNRLGMGGGFYDRTLAAWHQGLLPDLQPIGLAFDCQYVEALPHAPWDVPLPRVITPAKIWDFRT